MLTDYTFLTDHSYSLRPVSDENEEFLHEKKTKKPSRSSTRTNITRSNQTILTTNRTVSIDRSSSDKENNLLILSRSNPITPISTTKSKKKKSTGKKQTSIKSTASSIVKKKKINHRGKTKLLNSFQTDSSDPSPSLSIEERVKLRRTKPLQTPITTSVQNNQSRRRKQTNSVQEDLKQIRQSIIKSRKSSSSSPVVSNKSFLGSGLDLDNIVLGNRQRRCVQT